MFQKRTTKLFFLFFFLAFSFSSRLAFAGDVSVSATISDVVAPSIPILIEPADGAITPDNTPSFRWYKATDNLALSHYAFYLNGNLLYNNIPLIAVDNSFYTLDYDGINGIYTLTPKTSLNDASYTWKVVATDYAGLSSSSDTWDFTVDTLAPSFVLKKIGDTTVNISAANVGSVPSSPIIIFTSDATANEPILVANGEANSSVKLTVTIPGDPTQIFTTNIDSNGYYELKLGILPRDTDIKLDFIITDRVGHVSVLEKVYFRIALQYWPTSTLTLSPTETTPTPSPSSEITTKPSSSISHTTTPSPTKVTATPTGIIPIIPPKEIIHEVTSEFVEVLPKSTANYIKTFFGSKFWKSSSPFFALLLLILFYLLSFLILLSKFFYMLSWPLVKKIAILLFPTFFKAQKNLVFEYGETLASPLVKVLLLGESGQILDFMITNLDGNFDDLAYPTDGKWRLKVEDDNFYYPIGDEKPSQLEFWQFYQNQLIENGYYGQAILIPTLRAAGQDKLPFFERLRISVLYLLDYPFWFLIIFWLFSLVFSLRYQSIYNNLALGFYFFILLVKTYFLIKKRMKLVLTAKLLDGHQFSDNLVLSFFDQDSQLARSMIAPFEFSKSKTIERFFKKFSLTVFSKDFALEKNNMITGSQEIKLGKDEEISIQIRRVLD